MHSKDVFVVDGLDDFQLAVESIFIGAYVDAVSQVANIGNDKSEDTGKKAEQPNQRGKVSSVPQ